MLADQRYRRRQPPRTDPGSPQSRKCSFRSRFWCSYLWRDRCQQFSVSRPDRRSQTRQLLYAQDDRPGSGLCGRWQSDRCPSRRQWTSQSITISTVLIFLAGLLSCAGRETPQALFQRAEQAFFHGQLQESQSTSERAYERFRKTNPSWAKKFKVLEAKAAMWRGLYKDVLKLLQEPSPSEPPEIAVPTLTLMGIAHLNSHNFPEAERLFTLADQLCASTSHDECGYLLQA